MCIRDRKKTYQAIATMLIGVGMNILPFLFIYQIITPLIMHQQISTHYIIFRVIAIAISLILYAVFYVKGLALSHQSAYHTLKNLRISLQCKLEKQPLEMCIRDSFKSRNKLTRPDF